MAPTDRIRVRILREAREEFEAAVAYLEQERPGYGRRLLEAYAQKLRQIQLFPRSGPLIARNEPYELRTFVVAGFRYTIVVAHRTGETTILAFAHQRRAPGYWKVRLPRLSSDPSIGD